MGVSLWSAERTPSPGEAVRDLKWHRLPQHTPRPAADLAPKPAGCPGRTPDQAVLLGSPVPTADPRVPSRPSRAAAPVPGSSRRADQPLGRAAPSPEQLRPHQRRAPPGHGGSSGPRPAKGPVAAAPHCPPAPPGPASGRRAPRPAPGCPRRRRPPRVSRPPRASRAPGVPGHRGPRAAGAPAWAPLTCALGRRAPAGPWMPRNAPGGHAHCAKQRQEDP